MAWVICEGLDRTGKSTLAEQYKNMGYEVVHMSAPNKKYSQSGYTGPSYLDECLDMYIKLDGKDVFFDRTIYGEKIWPNIYSREPQLSDDDFEVLRDYEDRNDTKYILMHDPDTKAHWQRCVDFKENLNQSQFTLARKLFYKMAEENGFILKTLSSYSSIGTSTGKGDSVNDASDDRSGDSDECSSGQHSDSHQRATEQESIVGLSNRSISSSPVSKLDRANAINSILSKRILKKGEGVYDELEKEIRDFLLEKLDSIFGKTPKAPFSEEEITILKTYVSRIKAKMKE